MLFVLDICVTQSYILRMDQDRLFNLVAAFSTAVNDKLDAEFAATGRHGGAGPAAFATLYATPGLSIDRLARTLRLSSSGAVRLVDRLSADGLAERRAGATARDVSVWLTASGEGAARDVLASRARSIAALLDGMNERELQQLGRLVERALGTRKLERDEAETICRLCDISACAPDDCPVELAVER